MKSTHKFATPVQGGKKYGQKKPRQTKKHLQWFIDRIGKKIYGVDRAFYIVDKDHCESLVEYQELDDVRYAEFPL